MSQKRVSGTAAQLEVSNIGGIEQSSTTLQPGVTILTGKNATNRTSFLQAIMAACGSESATLKADANEGKVALSVDGEKYTRTLSRQNGEVVFDGTPFMEDASLADLFAFLLENNEARQAVAQSRDLREIIMRPVDTDEIERNIRTLESERDDIDAQLERLDSLEGQLPERKEEKHRLEKEIADTEAKIEEKNQEIEEYDTTIEQKRQEKDEVGEKIDELSKERQALQETKRKIEFELDSIESLESEREKLTTDLEELEGISEDRISQIENEIQRLRGEAQQLDATVGDLQSIIQFNEEYLEDDRAGFLEEIGSDDYSGSGEITDKLTNETEEVRCWTCGNEVDTDQIQSTLEQLTTVRNDKVNERKEIHDRIDDLQKEKSTLKNHQQKYERINQKLAEVEAEIDDRQAKIDDLKERKESIAETVDRLGREVEELESSGQDEILAAQKEMSRLEVELDGLQTDLADVENEIARIESNLDERESLERRRKEATSELTDLRTRVDDLQSEAIEQFNDHMDAVLERLGYQNLERIWIERVQDEVREGRRKVEQDRFVLHIVRSTDSGAAYEDTIHHLSESEREVTGLVFALAGYLVHEVYNQLPFMLLDSIETIDSDRIAGLIDYLAGFADYLVVALLEEDATSLGDEYPRIESI